MNIFPGGQARKDKVKLALIEAGYDIVDNAHRAQVLNIRDRATYINIYSKTSASIHLSSMMTRSVSLGGIVAHVKAMLELEDALQIQEPYSSKSKKRTVDHYLNALPTNGLTLLDWDFMGDHIVELTLPVIDGEPLYVGSIEFRLFMGDTRAVDHPIVVNLYGDEYQINSFDKFASLLADDGRYFDIAAQLAEGKFHTVGHKAAFYPQDAEVVVPVLQRQGYTTFRQQTVKTTTNAVITTRELSPISALVHSEDETVVIVATK